LCTGDGPRICTCKSGSAFQALSERISTSFSLTLAASVNVLAASILSPIVKTSR
jgi:hypothetical protein